MPYQRFAVGQVALLLAIVATNGAVGLVALAVAGPTRGAVVVAAAFVAMLGVGALVLLPERFAKRLSARWFPWEASSAPAVRRAWPAIAALQTGILLATSASLALCFRMGDAPVGLAACVLFCAAAVVTRVVSITPGAIGIREFLIGALAALTGFEARDAVIASTLARVVELAVIGVLGALFTYTLSGRVAESYARAADEPGPGKGESRRRGLVFRGAPPSEDAMQAAPQKRDPFLDLIEAEDPAPGLHQLRREDPVHWVEPLGFWLVTRHDDVKRLFNDPENASQSRLHWEHYQPAPEGSMLRWLEDKRGMEQDPRDHLRFRGLFNGALTPRAVRAHGRADPRGRGALRGAPARSPRRGARPARRLHEPDPERGDLADLRRSPGRRRRPLPGARPSS